MRTCEICGQRLHTGRMHTACRRADLLARWVECVEEQASARCQSDDEQAYIDDITRYAFDRCNDEDIENDCAS